MKKFFEILLLGSFVFGGLPGCRSTEPLRENPVDVAGDYYTVRGEIAEIQSVAAHASYLTLLHEPIEDFRNQKGELRDMDAMAMTFAVKKEVSLEGFQPKDKVEVDFVVRWNRAPAMLITAIERLPPEVELRLQGYSLEPSSPLTPPPLKQIFADRDSLHKSSL